MILYDLTAAQGWGTTKQHGGGKYAEIVFEALCKTNAPMVAMWDSRRWISENVMSICKDYNLRLIDIASSTLDNIVKSNAIKLIYSALPDNELLSYRGCRIIATLHGLRALEMPLDWIYMRYPISICKKAKILIKSFLPAKYVKKSSLQYYHHFFENDRLKIVTVSNHTKYAIATYFPDVNIDQIPVFYSPSTSFPIEAEKRNITEKYFLMVSTAREEKNALRAIIAFDRLLSEGKMQDFRMKLTGIGRNIFKYKLKNPNHFDFCGYISEEELNSLFANAYALVYPSLTEGFGYPPLEAMRYGVPVMASSFTSISEICGEAALYFNPYSIEEITNRLLQFADVTIYVQYAGKAKKRYEYITNCQVNDLDCIVNFILENVDEN